MLQDFRDKLRGTTAVILVAILIIPFAFWGVESLFVSGGSSSTAVTVNGKKISELDVARGIEMQRQALLNRFGDIDPSMLSDEQLRKPVIDQLVRGALLTLTAQKQGMAVSHDSFNEIILSNEAFQNNGRFDRGQYEYQLARLGFTPLGYRQVVMEEMVANQLSAGLQMSVLVSQPQADAFSRILLQERSYSYIALPVVDFAEQVEVSEAEITAYYEEHREDFREPDKIVVEYIELTPDVIEQFIKVDEQVLRDRFTALQQAAESAGVSWHLAHILIEMEKDGSHQEVVNEISRRLAAGEDFADLAREFSDDFGSAEAGGDLGTFTVDSLPEGFAAALEGVAAGEVTEPVETSSGTHFVKVLDKSDAQTLVFEEQRPALEQQIRAEQAAEKMALYLERLKEETFNVDSLEHAAKTLGLEAKLSQPFTASGGSGVARYPQVVTAAFAEDVFEHGYASEVLTVGEQHYIVVKLKDLQPAHLPELSAVSSRIEGILREEKARQQAEAKADSVLEKVKEGQSLTEIASEEGLDLQTVDRATRFDMRAQPELIESVFAHSSSAELPVTDVVKSSDQILVYTLTKSTDISPNELSAEEAGALRQSLARQQAMRELQAYVGALEETAKIKRR